MEDKNIPGAPQPEDRPPEYNQTKKSALPLKGIAAGALVAIVAVAVFMGRRPSAPPVDFSAPPPAAALPQPGQIPQEIESQPVTAPPPSKPLEVQAPKSKTKKSKRGVAKVPNIPVGEEAEEEELTEEDIKEAKEWDLPEKPKIDVNSPEYKLQLQNQNAGD